jgi:NitT/TauT family transport system substrate-binding protein
MKRSLSIAAIILLSLLLTACLASDARTSEPGVFTIEKQPTTTELTRLDVCYSSKSPTQESNWYALEKGIYEKYGLDVNLISVNGGSKAAAALISGDVDICTMASPGMTNAVVAGEDLVMTVSFYVRNIYDIVVDPDISGPDDLRGKTVAAGLSGGAQDTMGRIGLKSIGLTPDQDVNMLALEEESQKVAALDSHRVAGVVVHPPTTYILVEKGYKILLKLSTLDVAYQGAGVVTRRSFIQDHRDVVLRFNKAILESIQRMKKDQAGTIEVMAKYLDYDLHADQHILELTYQDYILENLQNDPIPSMAGFQAVLDEAAIENPNAVNVHPADLVDLSILDELKNSGFLQTIQ